MTRRYGIINLASTIFPLLIVIFYTLVQAAAAEYTEMSNAIVAICFILLHITRTLWGLWQLHTFRKWVENSIINLRKLGIHPTLQNYKPDTPVRVLSDDILVNETIIDNQIMHGLAQCRLDFRNIIPRQEPLQPIHVWLRWSTVFVAQFMTDWVTDFRVVPDPSDECTYMNVENSDIHSMTGSPVNGVNKPMMKVKEDAIARGRYFGAELAASASLHLLTHLNHHHDSSEGVKKDKDHTPIEISNPLLWDEWCKKDHMHDGRIRKAELFNFAVANTAILPFNTPHKEKLHRFQKLRHIERLTYAPFRDKLKDIISGFPIDWENVQNMDMFDVNRLEWFLILLHIGQLSSKHSMQQSNKGISKENATPENDTPFGAISNLQSQLGMESQSIINEYALNSTIRTDLQPFFNLSSIPFGHHAFMLVSDINKLVTKAGELVDIWLSLVAGQQLLSMMFRTNTKQLKEDCFSSTSDNGMTISSSETFKLSAKVEQTRLEWRAADFDQCYGLADHYITYMGYKMEYVRSFIALLYGIFDNNEESVNLFFRNSQWTTIQLHKSNIFALDDETFSTTKLHNRAVKCDLIWKLQNEIEKKLEQVWLSETTNRNTHSSDKINLVDDVLRERKDEIATCLASLFVLSFPSISIDAIDESATFQESDDYESVAATFIGPVIRIRAICGPQDIQVKLSSDATQGLTLRIEGKVEKLEWMKWRNSFMGRLFGFREWQTTFGFKSVPDLQVSVPDHISGGVVDLTTTTSQTFTTFSNWIPFRPSFSLFEFKFKCRKFRELQSIRSVPVTLTLKKVSPTSAELSDRRPVQVRYEKARNSTLVENILFIRERLQNKPSCDALDPALKVKNIISMAKSLETENLSRSLQIYEIAAAHYNSTEALIEYLKVVERQNNMNYWLSAIATIEGVVQTIVSNKSKKTTPLTSQLQSVFKYINSFVTGWGGMQQRKVIFNIAASFYVLFPPMQGREAYICLMKMLFYLPESDIDMSIRSDLAELSAAFFLQVYAKSPASIESEGRQLLFQRYTPRCLFENSIRIYNFGLVDDSDTVDNLRFHMATHTPLYPCRREVRGSFVGVIPSHTCSQDIFLETMKNLANAILLQNVEDTEGHLYHSFHSGKLRYLKGSVPPNSSINNLSMDNVFQSKFEDIQRATMIFDYAVQFGFNRTVFTEYTDHLENGSWGITRDVQKAVNLWETAIEESSNTYAMVCLARLLTSGVDGVQRNSTRAVKLLERAIDESHDTFAMFQLGMILEEGDEEHRDISRAAQLYERCIENPAFPACFIRLSNLLRKGVPGVERDVERAVALLERAIDEFSDSDAMWYLGDLFEKDSEGITRDIGRAVSLYERAIGESADADAMTRLARLLTDRVDGVERNIVRAVDLLERAINGSNHPTAMFRLAALLEEGDEGLERNVPRAVSLYQRSIELNEHPTALRRLANLLKEEHQGVDRDVSRAVTLFERAIDKFSDSDAMWYLGELLEKGSDGLPRNIGRSITLYETVINKSSDPRAMTSLARLLTSRTDGIERNLSRAVELLERAINESSHSQAMFQLATMLEDGDEGLEANPRRALQLYEGCLQKEATPICVIRVINLLKKGVLGTEEDITRTVGLLENAIDEFSDNDTMQYLECLLNTLVEEVTRDIGFVFGLYEREFIPNG